MRDLSRLFGWELRKLTIGHVLQENAKRLGDTTFLHFLPDGRRYSYRETDRLSSQLAAGLHRLGVIKGECVAVLMENSPEALLSFFAAGRIGAVTAGVNTAAKGDLLRHYLALVGATTVIVDASLLERVMAVRASLPMLARIISFSAAAQDTAACDKTGVIDFQTLFVEGGAAPQVDVRFTDPALLTFTSGTTGPSKASIRTHASMLLTSLQYAATWGYRSTDVFYVCLPNCHMNAISGSSYIALMLGGTVVLTRRFSASRFWDEVRSSGATTFNLLGSMLNMLWDAPPSPADSGHAARMCRAVPVPPYAVDFERRFGVLRLLSTYAVSDYGVATAYTLLDPVSKLGSAGTAMEGWSVRISDPDGLEVACGEAHERRVDAFIAVGGGSASDSAKDRPACRPRRAEWRRRWERSCCAAMLTATFRRC